MAKRFRFSLETLMRVRDVRERTAKRKVGLKQAELARLDQLNRTTVGEIHSRQATLRRQQQGAVTPAELVRERAWIAYLRRTILERQAQQAELAGQMGTLREAWLQTRTEKRIIEKLRERRWAEYVRGRKRREQTESDELARQLQAYGEAS